MRQQEKVEKLVAWFAKAAVKHAEAMESMQEAAAAQQVDSLNRYYSSILKEGGGERFLSLLEDHDPAVSGMAAVYAIREAPERCLPVLRRLARLPGLMGFRAEAALVRWESGEWPM